MQIKDSWQLLIIISFKKMAKDSKFLCHFCRISTSNAKVMKWFKKLLRIWVKSSVDLSEVILNYLFSFQKSYYLIFFPGLENVKKEDLDLANHLVGLKQTYIKMSFLNMTDLQKARKDLLSAVRKNKERLKNASAYQEMLAEAMSSNFEGKCDWYSSN